MTLSEERIQSIQEMKLGEVMKLTETDTEVKEYLSKDDFLMQTIIIDNYDSYANNDKSKELLEFETLSKTSGNLKFNQ